MKKYVRKIYKKLPFKKEFYLIFRKIFRPTKNIYQHLHFTGKFCVDVGNGKNFKMMHYGHQIENEVFWNGIFNGWEKVSLQIWSELCIHSKIIFDIGANTGIYALLAKTINPSSKIYAFEPVERVFNRLEYNNHINKYNIECVKKALSNFDGKATIYDKESDHIYSVTVNKDISLDPENSIPVEIDTIKLDSFIKKNSILKIDLLKIDVETHEIEVLEGFKEYIKLFEPTILIEILNDEVAEGIQNIISDIDYVFYNIDENSGIKKVSKLSKSDYYNFLICKPEVAQKLIILKDLPKDLSEDIP